MRAKILAPGIYRLLCLMVIQGLYLAKVQAHDLPLSKLNLPPGFEIEVFAEVNNARQLARGMDGTIYAGSRRAGDVFAIPDADKDNVGDAVYTIAKDLELPSGIAYRNGDLYIGAVSKILRLPGIGKKLTNPPEPEVITDVLPTERHHGWKFIDFGPDGQLYVPVGAPCNICLSDNPWYASILRIDLDAMKPAFEVYAEGVRNTVGFAWEPGTNHLWFTDNGRDWMGDDLPPCELNVATRPGQHFGYPFFHGTGIPDPELGDGKDEDDYVNPALDLGPHVAPLGMVFYEGDMFPEEYRGQIFIAEHGSWNRTPEAGHTGYRITMAKRTPDGLKYETFIDGWLEDNVGWGRPVDMMVLPDGSMLISDDTGNVIYRLTYEG